MITLKSFTSIKLLAVCLVTISVLGTSCTSLQQATTIASDDLYSTPALQKSIVASGIIKSNKSDEAIAQEILNGEEDEYQEYQNYQDDRYLRLKVANRNRWAMIDDYGYWNDPRYNNAYYPSYLGWNSWYNGYYGSSWYNPFGYSMSIGWGGYGPFMNSYYSLGWGFNDFGFGGFNDFGFGGYGGFGYGGFGGFGGFGGYGGWNPYYAGMWNPYGSFYGGGFGGMYGGIPMNVRNYDKRVPVQPNRTNLNPYMKNVGQFRKVSDVRENGSFVNSNNNGNTGVRSNASNGFRSVNSNTTARTSNGGNFSSSNSNTSQPSSTNFGSLVKRVMTISSNARAANFNNSSRNYSAPNSSNQNSTPSRSSSSPSYSAPASSGSSSGVSSSGGGGFIGGGRTKGGDGRP
jgi:hypothetical protein